MTRIAVNNTALTNFTPNQQAALQDLEGQPVAAQARGLTRNQQIRTGLKMIASGVMLASGSVVIALSGNPIEAELQPPRRGLLAEGCDEGLVTGSKYATIATGATTGLCLMVGGVSMLLGNEAVSKLGFYTSIGAAVSLAGSGIAYGVLKTKCGSGASGSPALGVPPSSPSFTGYPSPALVSSPASAGLPPSPSSLSSPPSAGSGNNVVIIQINGKDKNVTNG